MTKYLIVEYKKSGYPTIYIDKHEISDTANIPDLITELITNMSANYTPVQVRAYVMNLEEEYSVQKEWTSKLLRKEVNGKPAPIATNIEF